MKQSLLALCLALSLAFAGCEKADMPSPGPANGNSGHPQSGSKQPAGPHLANTKRQLPGGYDASDSQQLSNANISAGHSFISPLPRIRPVLDIARDCIPLTHPHAEPVHIRDTGGLQPLRFPAMHSNESNSHQWPDGDLNRPERFPKEATK